MYKSDFLKSAFMAVAGLLATSTTPKPALAAHGNDDPALTGLWQMSVDANGQSYHYVYAIGANSWTCTGDIDEDYLGYKFSPTVGAYEHVAGRTYKYRERGWVFDMKGAHVGSFESLGTLDLSANGNAMKGPGTWSQFDLKGKVVARESFTATAKRLPV